MNKTLSNTEGQKAKEPFLPADGAHEYICDMLKELTELADASELKPLSALLQLTLTAAQIHQRLS